MMDVASASVINENTQINFKGSTCQKSTLMRGCTSNAWVMVDVIIMITLMNHVETPNKQSYFVAPYEDKPSLKDKHWVSKHLSVYMYMCVYVCLWANIFIILIHLCHCQFQIWFYTNYIFKNAGIPGPYIQYTTVGTGAIEVISGMLGVSITLHITLQDYCIWCTKNQLICGSSVGNSWFSPF